jgi:hypothetical protein
MACVLRRFALVIPVLLASAACDDFNDYPPATPATVNDPAEVQAQQGAQEDVYADTDPSALSDFHAALDPHGAWVEDPMYGTVWVPNGSEVGPDFSPYETAGHWAYDDTDYVWASDYDWGWAPFHYGRWVYGASGWVWIPGRVYAPAWVDWRIGAEGYPYVGWGPAYPTFIWRSGVAVGYVGVGAPGHFYYCASGDIFAPRIAARVIAGPQVSVVAAHTAFYGGVGVGARVGVGVAHGPPPAKLGIAPQSVVHLSASDRGSAMARSFARPSTATKIGAHAPARAIGRGVARPSGAAHPTGGGGFHGGGGAHGGGHGGHR